MENEELMEVLAKSQEGTTLAMGALAELMQKQDATLDRLGEFVGYLVRKAEDAEEEEDKEREEDEEEEELEKMMSFLAKHFVLRKEFPPQGPDAEEKKSPHAEDEQVGADNAPGGAKERNPGTGQKTQPIIQASEDDKDEDDEESDDEGEEEHPKVEQLEKMVRELTAQLTDLKKGMDKRVKDETGSRLAKLGFKEETSLTAPKRTAPTERTDIVKSQRDAGTVQDELLGLSWNQLVNLRQQAETDQLPAEAKQLIGLD